MRKLVLVLGWYGHGNIGDEAFKPSFTALWPDVDFVFSDEVPLNVKAYDACMIGGGSFLDADMPKVDLITCPIAFVGVGVGSHISAAMLSLLKRANIIVLRDQESLKHLPALCKDRAVVAADLVYARVAKDWPLWRGQGSKLVSVLLSEHFVPRGGGVAEWVASSWTWFCRELAQVLDGLVTAGYRVEFLAMSTTGAWDDRRAAAHVASRMVRADKVMWYCAPLSEHDMLHSLANSSVVISQRLHGCIFAQAMGVPVVPVMGHDKVTNFAEDANLLGVGYYTVNSAAIASAVDAALYAGKYRVGNHYRTEACRKWTVASAAVTTALSL